MAAAVRFLEGDAVERRIELHGVETLEIDAVHFTVEVLGRTDLETAALISCMFTRFHHFHDGQVPVEQAGGAAAIAVRYDGLLLSQAAVIWGLQLVLQVPARITLSVTTTAGDVRIHDLAAPRLAFRDLLAAAHEAIEASDHAAYAEVIVTAREALDLP